MDREEKIAQQKRSIEFAELYVERSRPTLPEWLHLAEARLIPELLDMPEEGYVLNLGAGQRMIGESIPVGLEQGWDADITPLPFTNGSVGGIWSSGFFEHCRSPITVLRECERVLITGGVMNIVVPHAMAEIYTEDITHKCFFHEDTWDKLFTNLYYDPAGEWRLRVHACFILGVAWRNLALFTQIIKT